MSAFLEGLLFLHQIERRCREECGLPRQALPCLGEYRTQSAQEREKLEFPFLPGFLESFPNLRPSRPSHQGDEGASRRRSKKTSGKLVDILVGKADCSDLREVCDLNGWGRNQGPLAGFPYGPPSQAGLNTPMPNSLRGAELPIDFVELRLAPVRILLSALAGPGETIERVLILRLLMYTYSRLYIGQVNSKRSETYDAARQRSF